MTELALDELQRWMLAVVSCPRGVDAGATELGAGTIETLALPSASLTASERLAIYQRMYFDRLVDVVVDDYPALVGSLGEDRARALFRAYVVSRPSTHWNLNVFGRDLPDFVREGEELVPHRAFHVELARLERDISEVFDGHAGPSLALEELFAIAPEERAHAKLHLAPTLVLRAFEYPIDPWYSSWRDNRSTPPPAPAGQPSWLAIYRREYQVWRLPLTELAHAILTHLRDGAPLGEALERAAQLPSFDPEDLDRELEGWFQDWSGLGFFARVET